ncbi:hypothetical protein VTL71DRAFT_3455 [Oculimacula yallundae]|uniref:Secreted protein n=1 Tax=Oculimacula yallundae TaxID=86028 RepID=A0ABR4C7T5_9HELO
MLTVLMIMLVVKRVMPLIPCQYSQHLHLPLNHHPRTSPLSRERTEDLLWMRRLTSVVSVVKLCKRACLIVFLLIRHQNVTSEVDVDVMLI